MTVPCFPPGISDRHEFFRLLLTQNKGGGVVGMDEWQEWLVGFVPVWRPRLHRARRPRAFHAPHSVSVCRAALAGDKYETCPILVGPELGPSVLLFVIKWSINFVWRLQSPLVFNGVRLPIRLVSNALFSAWSPLSGTWTATGDCLMDSVQ